MCWVAAIPIAIAAGSAILGYSQQKKQADKQDQAIENGKVAQHAALDEQERQVEAQATDAMGLRAREAMIERGRLAAVAADSGLGGQGAERLQNESRFTEGFDLAALVENKYRQKKQIARQHAAVEANADARFASVAQPNLIGTGLQIGGAIAGGMSKQPNGGK